MTTSVQNEQSSANSTRGDYEDLLRVVGNHKTPHRLWTWHDPLLTNQQQRQMAELIATEEWCFAMEAQEGRSIFKSIKTQESDPPDCVIETKDGQLLGVEVTELIDGSRQAQKVEAWRKHQGRGGVETWVMSKRWKTEEVLSEIRRRICRKALRDFSGGPYSRRILLISSVESSVQMNFKEIASLILKEQFGPASRYDDAYFLAPPFPMKPHPQLCRIPLLT